MGRYLFTPGIFTCLQQTQPDSRGEIQLTDGIATLIQSETVNAFQFRGKRYDCGSKLGYLQACVTLGLQHEEIGAEFNRFLSDLYDDNCQDDLPYHR